MPQYPIATTPVPVGSRHLNITAATVIKAAPGRLIKVAVIVAGSTNGSANDTTTTGGVAAGNELCAIPDAVGSYDLNIPFTSGLVVTPGTDQTLAVYFQ